MRSRKVGSLSTFAQHCIPNPLHRQWHLLAGTEYLVDIRHYPKFFIGVNSLIPTTPYKALLSFYFTDEDTEASKR